jgi:murein L,D-transpeptidase YafK
MRRYRHALILLAWLLLVAPAHADLLSPRYAHLFERWVLVDTSEKQLRVYQGETPIAFFDQIAIGIRGTSKSRVSGDMTTPLGEFRIDRINHASRFHIFLGLDYPTLQHVDRALQAGVIGDSDYWSIFNRMLALGRPPQDTVLGGYIGIHGIGQGDPVTHRKFDWTQGCVALTNEQIERLLAYVSIGTRVVIR